MGKFKLFLLFYLLLNISAFSQSFRGYDLWLGYATVTEPLLLKEYQDITKSIFFKDDSATLGAAKDELTTALYKMLGQEPNFTDAQGTDNTLIISKKSDLNPSVLEKLSADFDEIGKEGFVIKTITLGRKPVLVLSANEDLGILYGVFRLLILMQQHKGLGQLAVFDAPKIELRMLNHWDNLDRTVERGYAGFSLWDWHTLPENIDQRYIDYARANASIGINAVSLTNVNANALILTPMYLEKVEALADVFRPYGIRVFLTARFSAPIEIGGLKTADPLDTNVQKWWNEKANEIYQRIPDFGGFLVKANSEGQPGPQNYGRNHVDGANMMAKALSPHNGLVIWRAFVYSEHDASDRAKQAYTEFVPYDGQFMDNVMVQVKNGAIDFQPREPFHPMFGA
ncbi:MAG: alpha-glucuronidase, partial [Pricia sp.]|nr:alpha-glucuronidase [Pricia sp.]